MGNIDKFDSMANQYDTPERMEMSRVISNTIRAQLTGAKEKTAMDFGCGTGLIGLNLLDAFRSVLFIDASPNMVEVVKSKLEKLQTKNAQALCVDLETGPHADLHADYIMMAHVLLHIKDTKKILQRLYELLNKGGHLLVVDFDKNEAVVSDVVHSGFEQQGLIETLKQIGFKQAESKTFYQGQRIFMNQDASLFLLDAEK